MKDKQSSLTAENNAAVRALEALRPANERICYDPFAQYFLSQKILRSTSTKDILKEMISAWENNFPGICGSILARTRFIDDCLGEAIQNDLKQLVILGAGYDTRSLRFDALKNNVNVFELDHPATQREKIARMKAVMKSLPEHVKYVQIRFDRDDLEKTLFKNGYDPTQNSFFIWEGVTYYIDADAVDRTLTFISRNSAVGGTVVFDYFPASVVDGTCKLKEAKALRHALKLVGEEIVFGIDPEKIESFLLERGFKLIKNLSGKEYKELYFHGRNENRTVSDMFYFVQASVA